MFFAYPGDDALASIGVSGGGTEDPDLPLSNGLTDDPSESLHIFGTAATIELASANIAAEGLFLINPGDLSTATVLFNGGGAVNVPIPFAERLRGHGRNYFLDLRAYTTPATLRTITITGAPDNQIGFGRIFLAEHVRSLHVVTKPKFKLAHLDVLTKSVAGYNFVTPKLVRNASLEISTIHATEQEKLELLYDQCSGRELSFPIVPWEDRTEVWWVKFTPDGLQWTETEGGRDLPAGVMELSTALEQWMGLPLDFPL